MVVSDAARKALIGGRVLLVVAVEGEPGGPNNDRLTLTMESGQVVVINSYAMSGMVVAIKEAGPGAL